jgi:hypothetical protein
MSREPFSCSEAQTALAEIKALKTEFEQTLEDTIKAGELTRARTLRSGLESRMRELREGIISPIERKLDLKRQYESERQILEGVGILESLPSGDQGIHGIDGKVYPMPSYQEIRSRIREQRDVLEKKAEQGFTKLLIVPFGMNLDQLVEKYKALLLKHKAEGKLFATKESDSDLEEALDLDTSEPVWAWDEYKGADVNGKLVYDPKEFSENHGGKTKAEILAVAQRKSSPAWRIVMIESDPNIPRAGKGKSVGGRGRIEANKTPNEYLDAIGRGEYQNESGTVPEEWLMQAITTLEKKNQVIDDYRGKGSIAYNTGAYFQASDDVPGAYWNRDNRRANLSRSDPTTRDGDIGARSVVRV